MTMTRIATVTLLVLASLALTGPASADSERVDDPRGDVTDLQDARSAFTVPSSADIVRTTGEYAGGRMRVTLRVTDLDIRSIIGSARLLTDDGDDYRAYVGRADGRRKHELYDADGLVPCEGLRGSVDNGADRITLSVPGECLGHPTWIRWGARTTAYNYTRSYGDDSRRRGGEGGVRLGERRLRED